MLDGAELQAPHGIKSSLINEIDDPTPIIARILKLQTLSLSSVIVYYTNTNGSALTFEQCVQFLR